MHDAQKNQIPTGYLSYSQIMAKYGLSKANLSKYIEKNNFPISKSVPVKGMGQSSAFKESEVSEWFSYKNKYIELGVVHQKLDIDLSQRFLRGLI
jgi:predicted DNA-binding transcriptional regulator AlpA